MELYYDAEFDAVRKDGRWRQCLISIGIIAAENGEVKDSFYSLIKPRQFQRLTRVVRKMTQLNNEDILRAASFAQVMARVESFLARYMKDDSSTLYSFGPDDKRTIVEHAQHENTAYPKMFDQSVDLQRRLSRSIMWQGKMVSPALSLDDLKRIYAIAGAVGHNALSDALDLMRIHEASRHGMVNRQEIAQIYAYKQQRLLEGKKRQYEHMLNLLHQRYDAYDKLTKQIVFYPDVIEALKLLFKRGESGGVAFEQRGIMVQGKVLFYDQINVTFQWHMKQKEPYVSFHYDTPKGNWVSSIVLSGRNATVLQDVWRMIS